MVLIIPALATLLLLNVSASAENNPDLSYLNAQEQAWLKEHPVLKVHNETDWAPFNFNVNGKATGFSVDYMDLIAERAGFKADYITGPSWDDFLGLMKDQQLDIMLNIVKTPERSEYLSFTSIYGVVAPVLAIRDGDKDVFSLNDFGDKTLCLPKGYSTHEYLARTRPEIKLYPLKDSLSCLRAMQRGEVDLTIEGDSILYSLFKEHNIQGLRISKIAVDAEMASELRIATNKEQTVLRDILEKTMQVLEEKKVTLLHGKWLEIKQSKIVADDKLNLNLFTEDEKQWIKDNPVLRIGNEIDWAPFDFVENNQAKGYSIDLIKLIGEKSGIKFDFANGYTWSELLSMIKDKQLDMLAAIYEVKGRESYILFSESYVENRTVLVVRNKDNIKVTLNDLAGKNLAVVADGNYETFIGANYPDINLVQIQTIHQGIEFLLDKSVDAYIGSRASISYTINNNMIYGLSLVAIPEVDFAENTAVKFGIRKDYPKLQSIINKTLSSISKDEYKQLINKWLPSTSELGGVKDVDEDNIVEMMFYTVLIILSLMLLLTYFSKKMASRNKGDLQTGTRQFRIVLLASLGAAVGIILLYGWVELGKIKTKILYDLDNNLKNTLVTTVDRLNNWVEQEEFLLIRLANDPNLVKETEKLLKLDIDNKTLSNSPEQSNVRKIVQDSQLSLSEGFFIINKDGISIASRRNNNIGSKNLIVQQMPEKIDAVFKGLSAFIPPISSGLSNQNKDIHSSLFIAVPIKNKSGNVIAALTKRLNPIDKFSQVLQFSRVGKSGETYAFNNKGILISESRFENGLKEIGLIDENQSSVMNVEIRDPGVNLLETTLTEGIKTLPLTLMSKSAINSAKDGSLLGASTESKVKSNIDGYRDYRGVPVVGAWLWIEHLGIGLASEMDVEEALSTYTSIKTAAISVFVITIIFIIGGTFFVLVMGERTNRVTSRAKKQLEDRVEERTKALSASEEESRSIVTNASDGIITINEEQQIIAFNPASEKIFGYSSDDIIGQPIHQLIPANRRAAHPQKIDEFKHYPEPSKNMNVRDGVRGVRSNGESFPAEVSISHSMVNDKTYYTAFVKDITERVEAEIAMTEAKEQADQANKAKSTFLANMSHELRTPMNAIIGYSEMLIEDAEDDENDEIIPDLSKINSAGRHLLELINDILDLSKIEAGKMELFLEDLNLRELIQEVIDTSKPLTDKNNNNVTLKFDDSIDIVHGDAMKIKQSMFNLISNAAKFTDNGEINIDVSAIDLNNINFLSIAISDSGIGIPENKLEKVFEEFSQADDSTTKDYGGTGLGLPLSVKFCKIMGGNLTLESEVGMGSTFTMTIPERAVKESESNNDATLSAIVNASVENIQSVLIIDDDENSRDILKRYLEKENFNVLVANDSDSGIQIAEEHKPDVITLDIMMPGKDGWKTLQTLKNNHITENIPVIMVSIVADKDTAITLGAVDALMKPIDKNLLIKAINRHLGDKKEQNILIIDDEQVNRDLISRYLDDDNLGVFTAVNGAEGIALLETVRPDLILLDLMMPIMDGFQFLEAIRQKEDFRQVPIIVITSKSLSGDELKFLNTHTSGVLQKGDLTKSDLNNQLKMIIK